MSPPTGSLYTVTDYLFNLITAAAPTLTPIPLADVFYGDQQKIPRTPAVCVFGTDKMRELQGAPRRIHNVFEIYVHLYVFKVTDASTDWRMADQLAEALEVVIHQDLTFGGLVYNSMVVRNEGGYLRRATSDFKGSRLTVQAESKTFLPMSPGYNQP